MKSANSIHSAQKKAVCQLTTESKRNKKQTRRDSEDRKRGDQQRAQNQYNLLTGRAATANRQAERERQTEIPSTHRHGNNTQ